VSRSTQPIFFAFACCCVVGVGVTMLALMVHAISEIAMKMKLRKEPYAFCMLSAF
jgi:hypothetical protein